jgi:hypothetical protein
MALLAAALLRVSGPAQLEDDPRLDQPVTVRAEAEGVGSLLDRLSEELGVTLRASNRLTGDLVVLCAKEKPAREVLTVLAQHFGWTWEKRESDDSYTLTQSDKARKEEEQQLEEIILRPYLEMQAAARAQLDAPKPDEQALRERIDRADSKLAGLVRIDWPEDQRRREKLLDERAWLHAISDPLAAYGARLFSALSREELLALDRDTRLVYSTNPTSLQLPITGEVAGLADDLVERLVSDPGYGYSFGSYQKFLGRTPREAFLARDVRAVRVTFSARNVVAVFGIQPDAIIDVVGRDGKVLARSWTYFVREPQEKEPEPEVPKPTRLHTAREMTEPLVSAIEEAAYGPRAVRDAVRAFLNKNSNKDPLSGYGYVLSEAADWAGVSLVADAYDVQFGHFRYAHLAGNSPGAFLDSVASAVGAKWSLEGDWVRMRASDWPLARASTVPRKELFAARDAWAEEGGLGLDRLAKLVTGLTDRQASSAVLHLFGGITWATAVREGGGALLYVLRMWDALSPAERTSLLDGRAVAPTSLNARAAAYLQEAVVRAWAADGPTLVTMMGASFFADDPDDAADMEWVERSGVRTWTSPGSGVEVTEVLPALWARAGLQMRKTDRQGVCVWEPGGERRMYWAPGQYASSLAYRHGQGLDPLQPVKPATITRCLLAVRVGPYTQGFAMSPVAADPKSEFKPYDSLPEELRQRIEELGSKAGSE